MPECHFWWKAGDTQWCDMVGEACRCSGWDDCCDIEAESHRKPKARLVAQVHKLRLEDEEEEVPQHRRLKRSA